MLYLSEIVGKKILDVNGNRVARVGDLVAEVLQTETTGDKTEVVYILSDDEEEREEAVEHDAPVIKGMLALTSRKLPPFFLPIGQVEELKPGEIKLSSSRVDLRPYERRPSEMLLTRDLWDKQVIDLKTRR